MYDLGKHFMLDKKKFMTNPNRVYKGQKYRISVLSECLVRIEYDQFGQFNDLLTPTVRNRLFPDPMYMHKEYKNFNSTAMSLNNLQELPHLEKGLYSPDGFVTIDDSHSLLIDEYSNIYSNQFGNKHVDLYLFMYNKDFGVCLQNYYMLTGYPSFIPRYALGIWWSKEYKYDEKSLLETLDKFDYSNIPLSVLILDKDWSKVDLTKYKDVPIGFSFNKDLFPNPINIISEVHARGLHFGLKINPAYGFYPFEDNFEVAKQYMEPNKNGFIPFNPLDVRMMDLYFKIFIHPLESLGVDLFWNDYSINEKNALYQLNDLMYRDLLKNQKRSLVLSRNSTIGAHRYSILYSGKNCINWNTLKILPFYNLNSANIGVSWWSHDVAGSTSGIEDSDFYLRSLQFGVFSPILRFNVEEGRYYKREPWKWDIVTNNIATYYLQLRHKLIPYIYSEAYRYHKDGDCLIKPLYYTKMDLYDDPIYVNQYMFGDSFMISPIITETDPIINRTIQKFYMPEGVWYDFKNGKRFLGNHKYISFYKIEDYPIFVKAGSIIPLAGESCYKRVNNPSELEVHIFPGKSNNYHLYEDDGITYEYQDGKYLITEIDYNYRASNYTVIIRGIEGDKSVIPEKRTYRIVFRNTKKADNVKVYENDQEITCETETTETDFIVIVKDFNTHNQLVVNCYGQDIEIDALMLIKDDVESILYDLRINAKLKDDIADIIFSELPLRKKRIGIRKLKKKGLDPRNIKVFLKLLEYMEM